jgi:hypothetical protein
VTSSLYETLSVSLDEDGVAAFLEKRPAGFTGKASELPRID